MFKKRTAFFPRNPLKCDDPKGLLCKTLLDYQHEDCYCPEGYHQYADEKWFQNNDSALLTRDFSSYYQASDRGGLLPQYSVTTHAFTVAPKKTIRLCSCVRLASVVKKSQISNKNNDSNNLKCSVNIQPCRPKSGLKISCISNSAYKKRIHSQEFVKNGNTMCPKDSKCSFTFKKWFIKRKNDTKEDDSDDSYGCNDSDDGVLVNKKKTCKYTRKQNKVGNVHSSTLEHIPEKLRTAWKDRKIVKASSRSMLKVHRGEVETMGKKYSELQYDKILPERQLRALKDFKIANSRSYKSSLDYCSDKNRKQRQYRSDLVCDHNLTERRRCSLDNCRGLNARSNQPFLGYYNGQDEKITRKRPELERNHHLTGRRCTGLKDCRFLNAQSNRSYLGDYTCEDERMRRKRSELEYDHYLTERRRSCLNYCRILNAQSNQSFLGNYRNEEERMRKTLSESENYQEDEFDDDYRRILYNEGIDDDAINNLDCFHIGPLPVLMADARDDDDFSFTCDDGTRFKLIYHSKCKGGMATKYFNPDSIDEHNSIFTPKCRRDLSRETFQPDIQKISLIRLPQKF